MARIMDNRQITKHLLGEGLLPENCRTADLHFEPSGAVVLRYEVFVTDADLAKVQRAIAKTLNPKGECRNQQCECHGDPAKRVATPFPGDTPYCCNECGAA